jgi:acyl-CoA thioesterase I
VVTSLYRVGVVIILLSAIAACGGDKPGSAAEPGTGLGQIPPVFPVNQLVSCSSFSRDGALAEAISIRYPAKWLVLGSSSAAGAGASRYRHSWAGQLAARVSDNGAELINIARGGYTTYQALSADCDVDVKRPQPDPEHNIDRAIALGADIVVVSFPSNDAALGYSAEEAAANIVLMRAQLAQRNTPLLVLSAQPRALTAQKQALLVKFNRLLQPLLGPCFVDVFSQLHATDLTILPQYDSGDGVHLNDAGHALVYQQLVQRLNDGSCINIR